MQCALVGNGALFWAKGVSSTIVDKLLKQLGRLRVSPEPICGGAARNFVGAHDLLCFVNNATGIRRKALDRRFCSLFGASPAVCARLWALLAPSRPSESSLNHLLWALLLLKNYATEAINSTIVGSSERSYRKWAWLFVRLISHARIGRKCGGGDTGVYVSVDETDCPIYEPKLFDSSYYSHTFKRAGLRYEIGISIICGAIIWANVAIVTTAVIPPPPPSQYGADLHATIRARHETVNSRIKLFRICSD
eukprot:IDg4063t1